MPTITEEESPFNDENDGDWYTSPPINQPTTTRPVTRAMRNREPPAPAAVDPNIGTDPEPAAEIPPTDDNNHPGPEEENKEHDNNQPVTDTPQDRGPNLGKHLCRKCRTLFRLSDGTRTCMHQCFERQDEFAPDVANQTLDIRDSQKRLVGTIAYVRGLEDHPLRDHVRVVHQLEASLAATNTMPAPNQESTTDEDDSEPDDPNSDESQDSIPDYRVIQENPEPVTRPARLQSETREDMLDEDSMEPAAPNIEEEPQPGPSRVSKADFAAMLHAARQGHPGNSTLQEAPPTARPLPSDPDVEDGTSPLRTRSGNIRGPPAQPKRRKPPPK